MAPPLVLMVAEKPSLAESIAKILSSGECVSRSGISCNVWEYTAKFMCEPAQYRVTSVLGHVFSCDFPKKYNNWESVPPIELFEAPVEQVEANPKSRIVQHLVNESRGMDYLILWLDCDREGENICYEVIRCVRNGFKPRERTKGPKTYATTDIGADERIFRAKFSAITSYDIKRALRHLVAPNENEAKAVDVRQELDLKIGCAFTRFQTRFFQGKYANLDSSLISFGPCQTPTLALCVKRHDEILGFVPVPYWTITGQIKVARRTITITCEQGRMFDRNHAIGIKNSFKVPAKAKVVAIVSEKRTVPPPVALNTVELLKSASAWLGISPSDAMYIAERLYMQGYISYPRTETSKYPLHFDLKAALIIQKDHSQWGVYACDILDNTNSFSISTGQDHGDHPPITPTRCAEEMELGGGDLWRLYDFITRHFIGTLSPSLQYAKTTARIAISGSDSDVHSATFHFSCSRVKKPGFTNVMHWKSMSDEILPAEIQEGSVFDVVDIAMKEGKTEPPEYLTESDLIDQMEKLGIGTDASMAVHISNIVNRKYVQIHGKQRYLVPTNLGIVLIHGYQKIDPDLALPTLRSSMEARIKLIADGKAKYSDVLKEAIQVYSSKFDTFTKKIENMDHLFEATFSPLASSEKPFSKCGRCLRYMHYINLNPPRLHCRNCNDTYSLPPNGNIKLFKELKCPLDNFELIIFSTGSKGKGYPLCPMCYNAPPFENIEPGMGCNACVHPTCRHSLTTTAITSCPDEGCNGVLVLDATSAPRWKMGCNKCNIVSSFNDVVNEITIQDDVCGDCGARLMTVQFQKKEGKDDFTGCVVCDDELDVLLETKVVRAGRYRGRGRRGRGGRGRGKGRSSVNSRGGSNTASRGGGSGRGRGGGGRGGQGQRGGNVQGLSSRIGSISLLDAIKYKGGSQEW
ncbi:DNA topoisomerase 3-beta-1-like protein [Polychytrium aggregatum]|uniref:DNA topoisomerase 3-beta-1-like protein n=1 Tax=Polychytrium aggregatum TaxID=110093 RepID=UPI0022FDD3B5|nr:DNA topoisomerase 3-beta-1-like protein [Polychytrium aggregatum]KAI9209300.1 DNA topoisomerase 3-beta-1-like protein [Polychytrium aggregatum]